MSLILATTYRGYLIKTNRTNGFTWVERGGACITTAPDRDVAKRLIDDMFLMWGK